MASVHDVAAYILKSAGEMSAMKLQKLVYYCQAWALVWIDRPLFDEEIEAWVNGPVVRSLYARHRGLFLLSGWDGNPDALSQEERECVDAVLAFYGDKSPQWLSDLTHMEEPWRMARAGLPPGVRGEAVITRASMSEYYSSISPDPLQRSLNR
jgi:uncharacterized phage-associated protein